MKKFITIQLVAVSVCCMLISITASAQPNCQRPSNQTSSAIINKFVNTCFDIYDNEEAIVIKVQSMNGQSGGNNAKDVLNKLDECVSGLKSIQNQAPALMESGSGMFDAAKGLSVFEYLKAFKNITNALKVLKYSLSNAKTLYETISGKAGAGKTKTTDTVASQNRTAKTPSVPASVVEHTTALSIKKIKYTDVQAIRNFLTNCGGVKNVSVKFDQQTAQVQVTHTLSTEEIWKQLNGRFPQLLSDENLTSLDEEAGKISIALK